MAASAAGKPFKTREGLRRSIETLGWRLESYDNEVRSVLREREACERSKKELEEALEAEPPSSDEEVVKQGAVVLERFRAAQRAHSEEMGADQEVSEEAEEEEDEEDELEESSAVSAKAKGKGRAL
jgi:hypothetical protein